MNTAPNIVAIVQARMGSTRLPGKILLDLAGRSILERVMARLQEVASLTQIVVATTSERQDDQLAEYCQAHNWLVFRGSENDVLDRFYQTARLTLADVIVRITSDCPLIDPEIVQQLVQMYLQANDPLAYVSNVVPRRTYPRGLDAEVFGRNALEAAWQDDQNAAWREHVTPFIYRNPDRFHLHNLVNEVDYSTHRWTVDTPEDYALIKKIYEHYGHGRFRWRDVLALLDQHPSWTALNVNVTQKSH